MEDDATRTLMVEFYRNLWVHEMSKIEALCQAQRTIFRRYDSTSKTLRDGATETLGCPPFYWAAFTLSGDWR